MEIFVPSATNELQNIVPSTLHIYRTFAIENLVYIKVNIRVIDINVQSSS